MKAEKQIVEKIIGDEDFIVAGGEAVISKKLSKIVAGIACDDLFAVVMYQQEEHNYACFFYCGTESDWTECIYKFMLDCNYTDLKRCIQSQLEPRLDQWKERIIKIIEKQKSIINVDCVARLYKSTDFYGKEKNYYLVFEDRTEVINYEATEVIQGVTNELQLMRHVNGE